MEHSDVGKVSVTGKHCEVHTARYV